MKCERIVCINSSIFSVQNVEYHMAAHFDFRHGYGQGRGDPYRPGLKQEPKQKKALLQSGIDEEISV